MNLNVLICHAAIILAWTSCSLPAAVAWAGWSPTHRSALSRLERLLAPKCPKPLEPPKGTLRTFVSAMHTGQGRHWPSHVFWPARTTDTETSICPTEFQKALRESQDASGGWQGTGKTPQDAQRLQITWKDVIREQRPLTPCTAKHVKKA